MTDWFNKKLNGQALSRRYRGDFWTEKVLGGRKAESPAICQSRKLDGEYVVKVTAP